MIEKRYCYDCGGVLQTTASGNFLVCDNCQRLYMVASGKVMNGLADPKECIEAKTKIHDAQIKYLDSVVSQLVKLTSHIELPPEPILIDELNRKKEFTDEEKQKLLEIAEKIKGTFASPPGLDQFGK